MQRHLQSHAEEQGAGGQSGKEKPQKRKRKRKKGEEEEEEERAVPTAGLEGSLAQCFQCSQCLLAFLDPQTAEQHVKSQHPEVAHPPGSPQHSQGSLPPCGEQGHCVGLESGGGEEGEMQAAVTDESQPSSSSTVCPLQRQPCDLCLNHEPPSHCSPDSLTEPDTPLPLALDLAPSRETSRRFFCQVCGERFYQEPSLQQHQLSNQHWTEPGQNQGGGAASGEGGPLSELLLQGCLEESLGGNRTSGGADGSGFEGRGAETEEGWGEDRPHGLGEAMGILERGLQLGSAEEGGGGGRLQGARIQGAELRESGGGASERGARGEAASEGLKQEGEREEGETPDPGLEGCLEGQPSIVPQGLACDLGVEAARRAVMKEEGGGDQQPIYCEILPTSEPSCLGSGEPEEGAAEVKEEGTPELGEGCFYLGTPELRFFHLPDLQEQHGSMAGAEWGAADSGAGFGRRHRPGRGARGEGEGEGVALVVLRQDESDSALRRLRREGEPPRIKEEEEEEEEGVFFSLSSVLEHGRENQPRPLRGSLTRTLDPEPGAPSQGRPLEVEEGRGGLIKQEEQQQQEDEEESVGLLGSFFPSSSSSSSSLQLMNHHRLMHMLPGPAGGEGEEGDGGELGMVVSVFQLKEEEELAPDAVTTLGTPGLHCPLPVSENSSSLGSALLEGSRGADSGCVELSGGSTGEARESGRGVVQMEGSLVLLGSTTDHLLLSPSGPSASSARALPLTPHPTPAPVWETDRPHSQAPDQRRGR
ncbi:uncharacterized protein LOC121298560 [Polyodon spathula]|uniref:uncharacterized protein LOC121298560 n=1 Tax=Polyodon spathula TaxID=7913 RepID=UPI001B7E6D54|nr:uncharacterized protein LOC121298560 [Polyodon spathula]